MALTVVQIREMLQAADAREFAALERTLAADTRKGVRTALEVARRRLESEAAEEARLRGLYEFERTLGEASEGAVIVGLDEVGRGAVAGPLAVGAVVLAGEPRVEGLNDSKQLSPEQRERIAARIIETCRAWAVAYVEPGDIDRDGMTASLKRAFRNALSSIEEAGVAVDVVLVDGNPLRIDEREVNVVKGDAKCASIAAASIVAKTQRDALMRRRAADYPEYGFDENKGYASAAHIEAIRNHGLSPLHRETFCASFLQETLF